MPNATLLGILRIQNRLIWNTFQTEIKNWQSTKNKAPRVLMLYHGTRQADPKKIYEGTEGFDNRYGTWGMWGAANYFAVNASYSDGYHHPSNGAKQMFYARVMIGTTIYLQPDNTLRKPPLINAANPNDFYDSVNGKTNGSEVFMTYTNKLAYPEYLITYQ